MMKIDAMIIIDMQAALVEQCPFNIDKVVENIKKLQKLF